MKSYRTKQAEAFLSADPVKEAHEEIAREGRLVMFVRLERLMAGIPKSNAVLRDSRCSRVLHWIKARSIVVP